jgi:purine-binding chemotaxis protein CheW
MVVDGISEMLPIADTIIVRDTGRGGNLSIPSWALPYAIGSVALGNRVIVLLDVARLLFSDKMQHYEI